MSIDNWNVSGKPKRVRGVSFRPKGSPKPIEESEIGLHNRTTVDSSRATVKSAASITFGLGVLEHRPEPALFGVSAEMVTETASSLESIKGDQLTEVAKTLSMLRGTEWGLANDPERRRKLIHFVTPSGPEGFRGLLQAIDSAKTN